MSFLSPGSFWWLLLAAPVLILYFMKRRRTDRTVSAVFLWRRAHKDARVDSFFQRLKATVLLILQLLALGLIITALSRPFLAAQWRAADESILILDASASMKVKQGGITRLDLAKDAARRILDAGPRGSRSMIIAAANRATLVAPFSDDKETLRGVISRLPAVETGTDLSPAVALALSVLKTHPQAHVYLITDGACDDTTPPLATVPNLHLIVVGTPVDNTGITSLEIRRPQGRDAAQLFVKVANHGDPQTFLLELQNGDRLLDSREVRLGKDESKALVIQIPARLAGLLRVSASVNDAFPLDNAVWAVLTPPKTTRVLEAGPPNPFLDRALALIPGVEVTAIEGSAFTNAAGYDIAVLTNLNLQSVSDGNYLWFHCKVPDDLIRVGAEAAGPAVTGWDKAADVMRFLDFTDLSVGSAYAITPGSYARTLVNSTKGPLVCSVAKGGVRGVYVAFAPDATNWMITPWFPMFVANTLEWLGAEGLHPVIPHIRSGDPYPLPPRMPAGDLVVTRPSGATQTVIHPADTGYYSNTDQVGIYTFTAGSLTWESAVNLVSDGESDLSPRLTPAAGAVATGNAPGVFQAKEFWWEALLAALGVVVLEWYWYHRRRT